jgi:hypothetical protein
LPHKLKDFGKLASYPQAPYTNTYFISEMKKVFGLDLSKGIGMGYVETSQSPAGSEIFISIRDKSLKAQIVKIPFI